MEALGVDLVWIPHFEKLCLSDLSFLQAIFTEQEIAFCSKPQGYRFASLAARFAAKEAVLKALGVGIYDLDGINLRCIEVVSAGNGAPSLKLAGPALAAAEALNLTGWSVSLSHSNEYAIAYVNAYS